MSEVDQQNLPSYTHPCAMGNEEEFNLAESIKIFMPLTKEVRVLVVDGDAACLTLASKMLLIFGYKVLTATTAADAFSIIEEKEDELKLILAEVHLPDMNRYEFIEKMTQVSKLPLVIMSDDDDDISMLGGLFKGATFYLVKPVTLNNMKNLWQFAYMNNKDLLVFSDSEEENNNSNNVETELQEENAAADEEVRKDKRKREEEIGYNKDEENEDNDDDDSKAPKKAKLVWSDELHTKFLQAVNALGIEDVHPKTILKHMNVPGLTKENISSHLQKYRISLKREQDTIMLRSMSREYFDEPGMGITNSMELAGGFGIGEFWESNNFIEEEDAVNGKMSFSNVVGVSDFGNAKDFPTLMDNSDQQQQLEQEEKQIALLSRTTTTPPPPAQPEKQEKKDICGEESGETELFDFTKQSTVVFRDEDLDDFW